MSDSNGVLPMDTIESLKRRYDNISSGINNKNMLVNEESDSSNNSIKESCKILKFEFLYGLNFKKISWELIKVIIDEVASSWQFISFTDNHEGCLIKVFNSVEIAKLLEIKSFKSSESDAEIQISFKINDCKNSRGIIYDSFLISVNEDTILNQLIAQGIKKVIKIYKNNEEGTKYSTGSVILIFDGEFREEVEILDIKKKVTKLSPKPMLCSHCGRLGHKIQKCKKLEQNICKNCFVSHNSEDNCSDRCKNCRDFHHTNDKRCPAVIKEIEILSYKEENNISYIDAKSVIGGFKRSNASSSNSKNLNNLNNPDLNILIAENEKLLVNLSIAKENEKLALLDLIDSNLKIKNLEEVVIPTLSKKFEDYKVHQENLNLQNQKLFSEALARNADQLKATTQQLNESTEIMKSLRLETISVSEKYDSQQLMFSNFIHSSEAVSSAYEAFNLKEVTPSSQNLVKSHRKSSKDRMPIKF